LAWQAVASANTASAIVARDGSGNFSAGTITAALTGNASTATNIANNTGTTTTVLHGNASGAPAFGSIVAGDLAAALVTSLATYTVTTDATTTRTLAAGDIGTNINFTSASAVTVTVPTGLGAGFNVCGTQAGAGVVSFVGSGTTLYQLAGAASTAGLHATVCLNSKSDTVWDLSGQLAGAVSGWAKYTVTYSNAAFLTAATAVSVTLAALPAHVVVEGIRMKHSVAWAGTAVSSATVSLGDGTTHTGYANAFDILQSVANTTQYWDGGAYSMTDAAHNLVARFTANTNFGNGAATVLTAGSVDIWVKTAVMP
jgi:trimeric autotransporter adhesin